MRVTQSMLSSSALNNLNASYQRMQTYVNQVTTGKKITKPSQDPVVAMQSINYRTEVGEIRQYLDRNIPQVYSWMDNTDSSLDEVGKVMTRISELTIQAANETLGDNELQAIAKELTQLIEHIGAIGNTQVNGQYIFNGTDTSNAPFDLEKINIAITDMDLPNEEYLFVYDSKTFEWNEEDGVFTDGTSNYVLIDDQFVDADTSEPLPADEVVVMEKSGLPTNNEEVTIEVMKGIEIGVNIAAGEVFTAELVGDLYALTNKLNAGESGEEISSFIDKIDNHMGAFLSQRAEVGAKYNRVEMIDARLVEQEVIAINAMSNNEDIDIERVIIDLLSEEMVLNATLAVTSNIIQTSLVDYLR